MINEYMTSRQRVIETINHRMPDRVPIDMGMYTATGISAFAYWHLRKYLGLPVGCVELVDGVQVTARVEEDMRKRFRCDTVFLRPKPEKPKTWNPRDEYMFLVPDYYKPMQNENGDWVVNRGSQSMRMPKGGYFFDGDWLHMENMWEEAIFKRIVKEAERLYKETDYFIAIGTFYPFFESSIDYFCDVLTDPQALIEANAAALKTELKSAALFVETMGKYVGAVCLSGDLGCQTSPMIRPGDFEKIVSPFLKEFCRFIHTHSDAKVFLHACGAIEPLLPALIDAGIDIINPVQVSAGGMDPENLKRKYGSDIVFWGGGVDTQNVLGVKSPEEVSENVKTLVDIFKPGGGYVFNPVHNILADVPPANIVAAFDTAYDNSAY